MRIVKLKGMRQVNGLHYAPDGRRLLAVGGYEVRSIDEARWVDVVGGNETLRVRLNASCYAVSPDLSRMAVGESHTTGGHIPIPPVVTFDPTDPTWHKDKSRWREVRTSVRVGAVTGLGFDSSGERLAVACNTTPPVFYTLAATHQDRRRKPKVIPVGSMIAALAYSPDGSAITTEGGGKGIPTMASWDAHTLAHRHTFTLPTMQAWRLAYSPDGNTLAVANWRSVFLLPPDLSAPRHTLAHPKQVNAVAFTPDGRRMLTTCTDKLVRVWDAVSGELITSYDWNVGVTNAIAVAPDGLTAAVSGQSGKVVLFDLV